MRESKKKDQRLQVRVHPARKRIVEQEKKMLGTSIAKIVRQGARKIIGSEEVRPMTPDVIQDLISVAATLFKRAGEVEAKWLDMELSDVKSDLNLKAQKIKSAQDRREELWREADLGRRTRENSERISLLVRKELETQMRVMAEKVGVSFSDLVRRAIFRQVDREAQFEEALSQIDRWRKWAEDIRVDSAEDDPEKTRKKIKRLAQDIDQSTREEIYR